MTRNTRLLILTVLIANIGIALGAIALKSGAWPAPNGLEVQVGPIPPRRVLTMLLIPIWMTMFWGLVELRNARRALKPAADFTRISAYGFVVASLFCVVVELWFANALVTGSAPGRMLVVRLTTLFLGGLIAAQGNFLAKSSPPTGEKAPEPSRWTRHVLRTGWGMVLVGVGLVVSALTLPTSALPWAMPVAVVLLVVNVVANRRNLRPA